PVANGSTTPISLSEDGSTNVTLTGSDADQDELSFVVTLQPSHGSLSGTSPNLIYTPNANYFGSDSFSFVANDGISDSLAATILLSITPVNDPPVANNSNGTISLLEDASVALTLSASDADLDDLLYRVTLQPEHGTLSGTAPNLTYTPNANYFGSDSFSFVVNDGSVDSATAVISLNVTQANDVPVANGSTTPISLSEDGSINVTLTGSDADQDELSFVVTLQPSHGSLSGTSPNLIYTPNANYFGGDSFSFVANDGISDSLAATILLSITPVNDPPVANEQTITTSEDVAKSIQLFASDVDSAELSFQLVALPQNGSLTGTPPNLVYTPNENYFGNDQFSFVAKDADLASSAETMVSISVTAVNDAPIANSQIISTDEDTPRSFVLSASDIEQSNLTYTIVAQPGKGTLNTNQLPSVSYTPSANETGSDSFTFRVNDGQLNSSTATISINIVAINDAPTAENLSISLDQDSSQSVILLGSDIELANLIFRIEGNPTHGVLTGTAPDLVYTPSSGYFGSDSFTYVSNDGALDSLVATVSISINQVISPSTPLNDTGVFVGANYPGGINADCTGETVAEQDCSQGRDVSANDGSDGAYGFSFTKLDAAGNPLAASATTWSCVKDNVTGRIWESKVAGNSVIGDAGLHDADDRYSWYSTDSSNNAGFVGYVNNFSNTCSGFNTNVASTYCNTQDFVARVNAAGLCGANDWRMPTRYELESIVHMGRFNPFIDINYFPNTVASTHWTATPYANNTDQAWAINFSQGNSLYAGRYLAIPVRLVRTAP
ncbi:MAG: Ig-like domain-containing protein, partial [Gammaproteobacteria bacterium]|nr:Ig-like domain-containing protein [Gammaproteobacteria bacterium]